MLIFYTYLGIIHTCMYIHVCGQVISIENLSTLSTRIGFLHSLHYWLHFTKSIAVIRTFLISTESQGASRTSVEL